MVASSDSDLVNRVFARAFATLHKRALGVAVGLTLALAVVVVTLFHMIARPDDVPILLIAEYFYGYETTWRGMAIGERTDGPTSEFVAEAAALLANVIERRGKPEEATALFDRAATILRPAPARTAYGKRAAYAVLADHYRATKRPDDEAYFRRLATGR